MISVEAKKEFVEHVMKNYRMKNPQCVWILSYLFNNETTLENVSFTEKPESYPRGMLISTVGTLALPFRYYAGGNMTADAERALYEIRFGQEGKIHVEIDYPGRQTCPIYAAVFESNPGSENAIVDKESKKMADQLIVEMEERLIGWSFNTLINMALDEGDDKAFMHWTEESKKMGEEMT